jgi:hypothetical protein
MHHSQRAARSFVRGLEIRLYSKCGQRKSKQLTLLCEYASVRTRFHPPPPHHDEGLRLGSTQENYPWIGTDMKIFFFVLKSLVPTQSSQDKEKFSCLFQSADNFPEWKLAFRCLWLGGVRMGVRLSMCL